MPETEPCNLEAEMCVLGCCISDPIFLSQVRQSLLPNDFYDAKHQIIYKSACRLQDEDSTIDVVTLSDALIRTDSLSDIGGKPYLNDLMFLGRESKGGTDYAKIVKGHSMIRQISALADHTMAMCRLPNAADDAPGLLGRLQIDLTRVLSGSQIKKEKRVDELLNETIEHLKNHDFSLITTGMEALDEIGGGIGKGEVMLIAGRPSMGKSLMLKQMMLKIAKSSHPCVLYSLEENSEKIGRNILSSESGVYSSKLRVNGKFGDNSLQEKDWKEFYAALEKNREVPFFIVDHCRTPEQIRASLAVMIHKYGIKCVGFDYLQLIRAGGKGIFEEATNSSRAIVDIAKDFEVSAIAACQPNRSNETAETKHLSMHQLRGSGQIEQDADIILFIHREDYYHQNDPPGTYENNNIVEITIGKFRDAQRGMTIKLHSILSTQKFVERSEDDSPF